ncbi:hypothetical protein [Streptosporangium sp. LJ11]|uniref:hypothetical protein n=1 Tax=Streptosporangium sp. LJ11 TaxID=3436927 RepID=UPI003F7AAF60
MDQFVLERYKYILQQIHAINENAHRYLALYQTLVTAVATAGIALFVGYKNFGIAANVARSGLIGLMLLESLIAGFTVLLVVAGMLSWFDYRKEECALTDVYISPGFRNEPRWRNFFRWHETYIALFMIGSTIFMWVLVLAFLMPAMQLSN